MATSSTRALHPIGLSLGLILMLAGCSTAPDQPLYGGGSAEDRVRAPVQVQDLGSLQERLLEAHNRERSAAGTPPLVWDPALAQASAAYGPMLAARGDLQHSPAHMRVGQGENLWMGTRGAFSPEAMVADWASEKRIFRPGTFPNISTSGNWADAGHYTQMIWRRTTHVGCALHQARQWDFLVCRYSPPGNVMGQPVP